MKLYGILSSACLVSLAGAAMPLASVTCPEGREGACCADPTGTTSGKMVIELVGEENLPRLANLGSDESLHFIQTETIGDDDQVSVVVKIVNDDMTVSVNGKAINPDHIVRKDGKVIIKIEGGDDIVVPLHGGAWPGAKGGDHTIGWNTDADGSFNFIPKGEGGDFTIPGVGRGIAMFGQPGQNHAIIGINISDADKSLLEQLGIDGAIRIDGIIEGSPAAKAGIKANDLLVQIDGVRGLNIEKLRKALSDKKPGERVELKILRHGNTEDIDLKLAPSMSFGAFPESGTGGTIEMSPNFAIDLDIEDMLKGLNLGDLDIEVHGDFQDALKKKLQNLYVELAPLHDTIQGQIKGKVYAELRDGDSGEFTLSPRLRLHKDSGGKGGVFSFDGGAGKVFRFTEDGKNPGFARGHDAGLDKRLEEINERMEHIEHKLDRLMRAIERD